MVTEPPCAETSADIVTSRRDRRWLGWVTFLVVFCFYSFLVPPTISRGGDCGEMVAASWRLGLAHPSGYPLYLLAGKLFASLFPGGDIGWRYNLFSALLASVAVTLIALIGHRLAGPGRKRSLWAAGSAAALVTGAFYFGSQALIAEVYALNALFLAALLWSAVAWHQDADWRWFYTLALLTGLALVTHLSCVFLLPSLFFLAVWRHRHRFGSALPRLSRSATSLALVLIAGTLLLYLPLRSHWFPEPPRMAPVHQSAYWPLDWGHPVDFKRIKNHATANQYNDLLLQPAPVNVFGKQMMLPQPVLPLPKWLPRIEEWASFGALQLLWTFPFVLVGAMASWKDRAIGFALTLTVLLNAVEFGYMVSDLQNFFFPTYIVFGIWLALGFAQAATWGDKLSEAGRWRYKFLAHGSLIITIVGQWTLFASTAGWAGLNVARNAALQQAEGAEEIRRTTGKPAVVVLPTDDFLWGFWYVRYIEGRGAGAVTPWGRAFRALRDTGQLGPDIREWQRKNAVVVGGLTPGLEQEFHLRPANASGNLWLLSNSPEYAQPVTRSKSDLRDDGLVAANIRRHSIWRAEETGVPRVLRGGLAALDVEIDAGAAVGRESNGKVTLEMLAIPPQFSGPDSNTIPDADQQTIAEGESFDRIVKVWRLDREIPLPPGTKQGQWRASLPLQIDDDARATNYALWARIRGTRSNAPAWTKIDLFEVVTR